MVLNAVQNGAKWQHEKHKNTLKWYKQNLLEPLKHGSKVAKWPLKSGFLGAKSRFLELKKYELATKLER